MWADFAEGGASGMKSHRQGEVWDLRQLQVFLVWTAFRGPLGGGKRCDWPGRQESNLHQSSWILFQGVWTLPERIRG